MAKESYKEYLLATKVMRLSLQIIFVSKQVICPARDKFWPDNKLVGQNIFFHHMFKPTGIVVQ